MPTTTDDRRRVISQQLALNLARMEFIRLQSNRLKQRVNPHLALWGSFELSNGSVIYLEAKYHWIDTQMTAEFMPISIGYRW